MSRGASSEADNVRDKTRYVEAPVLLSQESHPHLRGWNWRSSMRSWSWNYTAAFCSVGAVFCKISWSCRGFAGSWCVSEFLNQHWCGQALMCPLRREEREAVGNGTYCRSVCFHLNAVVFVFRSKQKGSWLSGLFTHFCDCLLVCWEMTYSPCETQTSLYHAACITLMEFCQLRIKCGLKKQL